MTSLLTDARQVSADSGYFIPVGNCAGKIFEYHPTLGVSTAAVWANSTGYTVTTLISSAGLAVLRDMGKTVVSSSRTFRKVQLVVASASGALTNGVGGPLSGVGEDYFTGYIELGFGSATSMPAPVAKYGR